MHAVTGHVSGDVRVWSVQSGTIIHELTKVHSKWIRSIALSPSGSKLLTASADGTVYAWDPQSGHGDPWLLGRHQQDARSVVFSPDGTRAISCSRDGSVNPRRPRPTVSGRLRSRLMGHASLQRAKTMRSTCSAHTTALPLSSHLSHTPMRLTWWPSRMTAGTLLLVLMTTPSACGMAEAASCYPALFECI
ncbi:WD40 domain-containing protein [Rhizoctonia solani AG-1 IA]|uniref:WD40 domain-containing protein n=1 Tax=Thanatephorus cucumeris (strain AG1-IA) TaxID=983506 RepID=L8X7J7_THACA|nr:WD40 domain-containing protein [Rhizoctonia solani AG-1 IA]